MTDKVSEPGADMQGTDQVTKSDTGIQRADPVGEPAFRDQVHELRIEATPDEVWRALAEAEGIVRWFTTGAEVEPGLGGRVRLMWEEMQAEGTASIDAWEPGKRLLLRHLGQGDSPEMERPVLEEWTIEDAGGETLLRLVQSHVPADASWDEYYESTFRGWRVYLAHLKHGLTVAKDRPRLALPFMYPLDSDRELAWRRLVGEGGLAFDTLEVESGTNLRLPAALGGFEATVLEAQPPASLVLTVQAPDYPVLAVMFEGSDTAFLWAQASVYPAELNPSSDATESPGWGAQAAEWVRSMFPPVTDATEPNEVLES